ncbi:MAG: CinA family nicotinamide mononucleotide deamidase-related protein [Proteobacteria bacterium]|nr:CinA family nicotinamide mononucleotide deamidase-related protein [Pseudomonadota bacterium]
MHVETLSTGDEISSGQVVDTNSSYIANFLLDSGLRVKRHSAVGDDLESLAGMLKEISNRADIAIVTGGLGPTTDDLTAEAVAKAAGVSLELNDQAQSSMRSWFEKRGFNLSLSDNKQAMLPIGSICLVNDVGTAPGFAIRINRCMFYFMPGVPHEMKTMISSLVMPSILKLQGQDRKNQDVRILSVFGLPEASLSEHLKGFARIFPDIRLGFRAVFPTLQVKLHAEGEEKESLDQKMASALSWIETRIGNFIFSREGRSLEETVGKLLKGRNATLAVAESCTGGLISHMLTDVAGSSDYFLLSAVTYSNPAKTDMLGVSERTLAAFGAVSEETVSEMADGVRKRSGATYGIATSGIAGPGGGTADKPVGTVCIGFASLGITESARYCFTFDNRSMNKKMFAAIALETLRRKLAA